MDENHDKPPDELPDPDEPGISWSGYLLLLAIFALFVFMVAMALVPAIRWRSDT